MEFNNKRVDSILTIITKMIKLRYLSRNLCRICLLIFISLQLISCTLHSRVITKPSQLKPKENTGLILVGASFNKLDPRVKWVSMSCKNKVTHKSANCFDFTGVSRYSKRIAKIHRINTGHYDLIELNMAIKIGTSTSMSCHNGICTTFTHDILDSFSFNVSNFLPELQVDQSNRYYGHLQFELGYTNFHQLALKSLTIRNYSSSDFSFVSEKLEETVRSVITNRKPILTKYQTYNLENIYPGMWDVVPVLGEDKCKIKDSTATINRQTQSTAELTLHTQDFPTKQSGKIIRCLLNRYMVKHNFKKFRQTNKLEIDSYMKKGWFGTKSKTYTYKLPFEFSNS